MTFLHPQLLWLLLLLPALLIIYIVWRRRQQASLRVPSLLFISGVRGGLRVYLRHVLFALRLLALGLIIVALARPQSSSSWSEDRVEGSDLLGSLDAVGLEVHRQHTRRDVHGEHDVDTLDTILTP